jgi:hypothetical protein
MSDIDQDRFALMAALMRAHDARPDEYPASKSLESMNDQGLRGYALGLLDSLERASRDDQVAMDLREELQRILHEAS